MLNYNNTQLVNLLYIYIYINYIILKLRTPTIAKNELKERVEKVYLWDVIMRF